MSSLRSIDLTLIDEILRGDSKGYVLDFSNRTFAEFFVRELDIDIDAPIYEAQGTSKAKRLACFLDVVDDQTAARTLRALWERREALRPQHQADPFPRAASQFAEIVAKLEGQGPTQPMNIVAAPVLGAIEFDRLRSRLVEIRDMAPQMRGYAFETFLRDMFDAFRLNARDPFRLTGEQIDGSFELQGETYLLEAKWLNRKVGVAELGAFHSKLDQKAAWARGLFISFQGFSTEGLEGFGRGRRLVGMEGKDIYDALQRGISIDRVIGLKVRHAAETGKVFAPLDQLVV